MAVDAASELSAIIAAASIVRHRPAETRTRFRIAHLPADAPRMKGWAQIAKAPGVCVSPVEVDAREFGHCKGMFGSLAVFLRLYIPSLSSVRHPVYIDTDTVFFEDIGRMVSEVDCSGWPLAMPPISRCGDRVPLERALLARFGKSDADPYFCSGMCVFDREEFLRDGIFDACVSLARTSPGELPFCDQSLLNAVCPHVGMLDRRWNQTAFPDRNGCEIDRSRGGAHFIGAPKPWDLFAEFLHPHARVWIDEAGVCGLSQSLWRRYFRRDDWRWAWRIRRQYRRWFSEGSK